MIINITREIFRFQKFMEYSTVIHDSRRQSKFSHKFFTYIRFFKNIVLVQNHSCRNYSNVTIALLTAFNRVSLLMILKLWQHSFLNGVSSSMFLIFEHSQIIKMKIFILYLLQMELSLLRLSYLVLFFLRVFEACMPGFIEIYCLCLLFLPAL